MQKCFLLHYPIPLKLIRAARPIYTRLSVVNPIAAKRQYFGSEAGFEAARQWRARCGNNPIPSNIGEISYARSSGPGGQNVNKVNSKAQLRIRLDLLLPLLPAALHEGILNSRYHAEKSGSLLFQADESRKQTENKESCYRRLNELVMDVYKQCVPGETSVEQKEKVKRLRQAENESRLKMKKIQSSKKAGRGHSRHDE